MNQERIDFLKKDYTQGFPAFCGFEVKHVEQGVFEAQLKVREEHKQQDGFVHAGVIATIADHTAGYSAYTIVPENMRILTIEFKINYLRPAKSNTIRCRSKVINKGKKIIVAESEVFSISAGKDNLVSKAIVTLMSVPESNLNQKA